MGGREAEPKLYTECMDFETLYGKMDSF